MGQQVMAIVLAAGATNEEVIAAGVATQAATLGAGEAVHIQD
jgi:hypothetical protein